MSIVFRQLFDADTCTFTYLLADPLTGDAILIDSVRARVGEYVSLLQEMNLQLVWALDTHAHADQLTGAASLRELTGAQTVAGELAAATCADRRVSDGDTIVFGNEVLRVLPTPGHTPGCVTYHWRDRLFTGDSLMIGGCGRTDFEGGSAETLYESITLRLFSLPGEALIYPGHDYKGARVSCIDQERRSNPRLAGKTREDFVDAMSGLNLPKPMMMDCLLPANRNYGRTGELIDIHAA